MHHSALFVIGFAQFSSRIQERNKFQASLTSVTLLASSFFGYPNFFASNFFIRNLQWAWFLDTIFFCATVLFCKVTNEFQYRFVLLTSVTFCKLIFFAVLVIFSYLGFNEMSVIGILFSYYICELLYCTCLEYTLLLLFTPSFFSGCSNQILISTI